MCFAQQPPLRNTAPTLEPSPPVQLRSSDGVIFEAPLRAVRKSNLLRWSLDKLAYRTIIRVRHVDSSHLRQVLAWCEYHQDDIVPDSDDYFGHIEVDADPAKNRWNTYQLLQFGTLCPWDRQWQLANWSSISRLLEAAYCLDIPPLFEMLEFVFDSQCRSRERGTSNRAFRTSFQRPSL